MQPLPCARLSASMTWQLTNRHWPRLRCNWVPMCRFAFGSTACRMRGIGDIIDPWPDAPRLHAVLVNPLVGVSTASIFRHLGLAPGSKANAAITDAFADATDTGAALAWLALCRNDLEPAACHLEPVISDVLGAVGQLPGCGLARMSGSGATCFGLFADAQERRCGREDPGAGATANGGLLQLLWFRP